MLHLSPVRHKGMVHVAVVADGQEAAKVCADVRAVQKVLLDAKRAVARAAEKFLQRLDLQGTEHKKGRRVGELRHGSKEWRVHTLRSPQSFIQTWTKQPGAHDSAGARSS